MSKKVHLWVLNHRRIRSFAQLRHLTCFQCRRALITWRKLFFFLLGGKHQERIFFCVRRNKLLAPQNGFGEVQIASAFTLLNEETAKEKAKVTLGKKLVYKNPWKFTKLLELQENCEGHWRFTQSLRGFKAWLMRIWHKEYGRKYVIRAFLLFFKSDTLFPKGLFTESLSVSKL